MKNTLRLYLVIIFISFGLLNACSKSDTLSSSGPGGVPSINNNNNKIVGASAKELLTATKSKLVIEINYMPGYQLQSSSIANLVSYFENLLNKPGGISVIEKQIAASTKDPLTIAEIGQIEKDNRTTFNTDSQVAVYFLITNGGYSTANVLGVAYRNTSMCIFGKTINSNSGGLGQASRIKVESTVLNHEAGHILGLVDIGTPMVTNHKDGSHPDHCNNSNCLMYYAAETTEILGFLITGSVPPLDQNCRNDLKAYGGK